MIPPVFSLTLRQKETISETTAMDEDDVVEKMFNIVRYKTRNNPPQNYDSGQL